MTDNTQPEALRLANALEYCDASVARQAINELRSQHARIAELEAQPAAIGAGGVSPLIGQPQAMPDLSQLTERGAVAWAGVDAQELREGGADMSKERKAFEAWYIASTRESLPSAGDGWSDDQIRDAFIGPFANSKFRSSGAQIAWEGWQARASLRSPGFTAADMATAAAQGFRDGAASTAPPAAQAGGWRLIPAEPTGAMLAAAEMALYEARSTLGRYAVHKAAYRALLAAAPPPPTSAEGVGHAD